MLKAGVIEKSSSAWSSPIILVKKKDGTHRFVVDFRKLNSGAKYISTLDVKAAYWQIQLTARSKEVTAFTVSGRGLFQFTRMSFGLHSGGASWQKLIDRIVGSEFEQFAFAYIDDVVVVTETFEEHMEVLRKLFARFKKLE